MSEKVYVVCCHVVDEDIPLKAFHDIKKAEGYMLKGTGISIMDEQTFYDMIEAGDE